jgi:hypothetical protein
LVPHHEQQASKWNGEKQHRELWPAYNSNIAPPQASTEGLFQQTRLITTVSLRVARQNEERHYPKDHQKQTCPE